jgi:hypothetical protein
MCWWKVHREINVFPRFEYHVFYVLYPLWPVYWLFLYNTASNDEVVDERWVEFGSVLCLIEITILAIYCRKWGRPRGGMADRICSRKSDQNYFNSSQIMRWHIVTIPFVYLKTEETCCMRTDGQKWQSSEAHICNFSFGMRRYDVRWRFGELCRSIFKLQHTVCKQLVITRFSETSVNYCWIISAYIS